jgi:hypothetical protein
VTPNESGGIVALVAQTQQIIIQALRQIQFATEHVKPTLPIGNLKELGGGTELLPQRGHLNLDCAVVRGSGISNRRWASDG